MNLPDVIAGAILPELVHLAAVLTPSIGSAVVGIGRSGGHVRLHWIQVREDSQTGIRFHGGLHGKQAQIVQQGKPADLHIHSAAEAALQQDGLAAFALGSDAAGQRHRLFFLGEIIADRDLTAITHYGQKRSVADTHPAAGRRAFGCCGRGQNVRLQVPADIEIDRPGGQGQQEQQAESGQRPEGAACKKQRRQRQQQDQITQGAA